MSAKEKAKEGVAINKVVSVLTTSVAPLLNPFIYTLRNKQVKAAFKDTVKRIVFLTKKFTVTSIPNESQQWLLKIHDIPGNFRDWMMLVNGMHSFQPPSAANSDPLVSAPGVTTEKLPSFPQMSSKIPSPSSTSSLRGDTEIGLLRNRREGLWTVSSCHQWLGGDQGNYKKRFI
ncbi:hypothetical protein ACRRTK_012297 [Alexandromys fortis]